MLVTTVCIHQIVPRIMHYTSYIMLQHTSTYIIRSQVLQAGSAGSWRSETARAMGLLLFAQFSESSKRMEASA